jgi:hypothetical protein
MDEQIRRKHAGVHARQPVISSRDDNDVNGASGSAGGRRFVRGETRDAYATILQKIIIATF